MSTMLTGDNLNAWLGANIPGFQGPFTLDKFPGGQSNPTYKLSAASGNYVLRRKPFGVLLASAHAIEREFQVLAALAPLAFPVPKPLALCQDPEVAGAAFYVMGLVEGGNYWDGSLPEVDRGRRRRIYVSMVETLAALHKIDFASSGLSEYGKSGSYFDRQVSRWIRQYRQSQTDHVPEMESLIAWLPHSAPRQSQASIVHGDYRLDNLIFAEDDSVRAVLDWELSTIGDPLADFSYLAMHWVLPAEGGAGLSGLDLPALGIPTLDELVVHYCALTGREAIPDLAWYFAFNLFRVASILQGIKKRVTDGSASNSSAAETSARLPMIAALAWRFAREAAKGDTDQPVFGLEGAKPPPLPSKGPAPRS